MLALEPKERQQHPDEEEQCSNSTQSARARASLRVRLWDLLGLNPWSSGLFLATLCGSWISWLGICEVLAATVSAKDSTFVWCATILTVHYSPLELHATVNKALNNALGFLARKRIVYVTDLFGKQDVDPQNISAHAATPGVSMSREIL